MELAEKNGCRSIALPLISSGIYGYPKAEALRVAVEAIREFLLAHDIEVYLSLFDREVWALAMEQYAEKA